VPTTSNPPHTVESLLRVVEARDTEVALLKLMVDKLKAQLLRRLRAQFGPPASSLMTRRWPSSKANHWMNLRRPR
jgi:hypothetical protein